ncbi:50S ribosomal protein L10 [archaeon]|nr:50S ribosomal protein L10 [archaeon]|tara:strand:- start:3160 stop:3996 length:837 start_codon:yes stop_codon:yes gene_type:complete
MVSSAKKELVASLKQSAIDHSVVGVVNVAQLPAQQFQRMRRTLNSKGVKIVVARKKLMIRALEESKQENILKLVEKMKGIPGLLFSTSNPFVLYAILQKNKSEAPAKAGHIAPKDIIVKEGLTSFLPGPIISELASVGIKTKVDGGKLAIIADTVVAKEGDTISENLAAMLKRLDITPMEIGLDLVAAWEAGFIFNAKDLGIDEEQFAADITAAAQWAVNLAVEVGFPTSETLPLTIQKAQREAVNVAVEAAIMNDATREAILAKAEREAAAVEAAKK